MFSINAMAMGLCSSKNSLSPRTGCRSLQRGESFEIWIVLEPFLILISSVSRIDTPFSPADDELKVPFYLYYRKFGL